MGGCSKAQLLETPEFVCFLAEGDGHVQGEILEWRALSRAGPRDENRVWSVSAAHTVHMCVGGFHLVGYRVPEHARWLLPGILEGVAAVPLQEAGGMNPRTLHPSLLR